MNLKIEVEYYNAKSFFLNMYESKEEDFLRFYVFSLYKWLNWPHPRAWSTVLGIRNSTILIESFMELIIMHIFYLHKCVSVEKTIFENFAFYFIFDPCEAKGVGKEVVDEFHNWNSFSHRDGSYKNGNMWPGYYRSPRCLRWPEKGTLRQHIFKSTGGK